MYISLALKSMPRQNIEHCNKYAWEFERMNDGICYIMKKKNEVGPGIRKVPLLVHHVCLNVIQL